MQIDSLCVNWCVCKHPWKKWIGVDVSCLRIDQFYLYKFVYMHGLTYQCKSIFMSHKVNVNALCLKIDRWIIGHERHGMGLDGNLSWFSRNLFSRKKRRLVKTCDYAYHVDVYLGLVQIDAREWEAISMWRNIICQKKSEVCSFMLGLSGSYECFENKTTMALNHYPKEIYGW